MVQPNFKTFFHLLFFATCVVACSDDDSGVERPDVNIAGFVNASTDLSTLAAALERTNLMESLEGTGFFTLLAPSNVAFEEFLDFNDFADINEVPVAVLRELLLNHVIAGEFQSNNLTGQVGYVRTFAEGPDDDSTLSMLINGTGSILFNNSARISDGRGDNLLSNGTVHIVNAVVELPTLATLLVENPGFSNLVEAATTATPSEDFEALLSGPGPITVFAPANSAFEVLFSNSTEWNEVDDIDEDTLIAVLNHHLVSEENILADDIQNGQQVATLEGDVLAFTLEGTNSIRITDGSGSSSTRVAVGNIQGTNGVFHVIDRVLIPNTDN
ncbi:MAG: fasciclin domain-containing protein [Bacteroidota bacterium]